MELKIPKFGQDQITFLLVREGRDGIETVIDSRIEELHVAYRGQVKAFLEGVIKSLDKKKGDE